MNHWLIEVTAEARRMEILAQMENIRRAFQVPLSLHARPGLYRRSVLRPANWMVATGRDLRCHYGLRSADCASTVTGSPAR